MESSRAAKLATARKKLENHQRKKKTAPDNNSFHNNNVDREEKHSDIFSSQSVNGDLGTHLEEPPHTFEDNHSRQSINEPKLVNTAFNNTEDANENIGRYLKSIEILVNDKSDLTNQLKNSHLEIARLNAQSEELLSKLNLSNKNISEIGVELSALRNQNGRTQKNLEEIIKERDGLLLNERNILQKCKDFEEKVVETTSTLRSSLSEKESLRSQLQQLQSDYEICQLHLQQVSQVNNNLNIQEQMQSLISEKSTYHRLLEETQAKLDDSEADKNIINQQYQQYVQQLNNQLESLTEKHKDLLSDYSKAKDHEQSLIYQMGNLEKQLQSMQGQPIVMNANNESMQEIAAENMVIKKNNQELNDKLKDWESKYEIVQATLIEKDTKLEELKEEVTKMETEKLDVDKLNAANESDRVAAQLATAQNSKLKVELTKLQEIYSEMVTVKLELTQLLETERNLNKDLMRKLGEDQYNVKDLQIKLKAKDDEMIRLQSNCRKLETEILQVTQVNDNLRHYEAVSQNLDLLQSELDNTRQKVFALTEENRKLKIAKIEAPVASEATEDDQTTIHNDQMSVHSDSYYLPTDEAMEKLQERFTVTVKQLAELTDEKQELEHIVLQLQGETETICEYIALYHKQRGVLKQRELEKNSQLAQIAQERSKMKEQLDEVKRLVSKLVQKRKRTTSDQDISNNIDTLLEEITHAQLSDDNTRGDHDRIAPSPCCSGKIIDI